MSGPIRVAIAGVGNCASSLVQGVEYYRDADPRDVVPGLMHDELAGYHGVRTETAVDAPPGLVLPVRLRTPYGLLSLFPGDEATDRALGGG